MDNKLDDIKYIQNTLWSIYKDFLQDHDIREYTSKAAELVHKYKDKHDMMLFCQNLIITWTPVLNGLNADFIREEMKA